MHRDAAEAVVTELRQVADIRIRAMMGGWLVYAHEVLVGQVDNGELFFKPTNFAQSFAPDLPRRPPYPDAKPALVVSAARRADAEWLHALVAGSVEELRPRAPANRQRPRNSDAPRPDGQPR